MHALHAKELEEMLEFGVGIVACGLQSGSRKVRSHPNVRLEALMGLGSAIELVTQ